MKKNLPVLLLYVVLTLIMTYPLLFNLTNSIPGDLGDPLLNTWILAWDVHKIMEGDLFGLFNANIFFPYNYTLAYSEHMLGSAVFALPIIAFLKNSVLAYNFIFLLAMSLSGFGMYLLVSYLTGNRLAAFCAGVIYAFFPWRFGGRLGHLQLQVAQWIPLTFLYLHKFVDSGRYKHLILFTTFFVIQFLSTGYYAMFLSVFVSLFILMEIWNRGFSDKTFFYKLGLFFFISAVLILPFFYPYIKVKHELGFVRAFNEIVNNSADVLSYLSAPLSNPIWGEVTKIFWKPEGELFLGLTAILLASVGVISQIKIITGSIPKIANTKTKTLKILSWIIGLLLVVALCDVCIIWLTGGFNFTIFGIKVRSTRFYKPVTLIFILIFIRLLMEHRFRNFLRSIFLGNSWSKQGFYLLVLILSFLFSLGPFIHFHNKEIIQGPYILLYKFFPGFDGLRTPARFVIIVAFAVSVFAAFGIAEILKHFEGRWKKTIVAAGAALLIMTESVSIPIPTPSVAVGSDIPEVYKWLAGEKGDFAIMEMPLPENVDEFWREIEYVYYSSYHWKRLVNGYSGYYPPAYAFFVQEGMKGFPTDKSVGLLKELKIRYLIIHSEKYTQKEWESIKKGLQNYVFALRHSKQFGPAYVYEMTADYAGNDPPARIWKEIPRGEWSVEASAGEPHLAIDGDLKTRWTTGHPQRPSDFFMVDLGEIRSISRIVLELGPDLWDYPRGYRIESSIDGMVWKIVKQEKSASPSLRSIIERPKAVVFDMSFPPDRGRFIKITQIEKNLEKYWSIREIRLFE